MDWPVLQMVYGKLYDPRLGQCFIIILSGLCYRWPRVLLLNTSYIMQGKFFTQLKHSADGFGVVAEFFGRGLMNNTSVTTAAE